MPGCARSTTTAPPRRRRRRATTSSASMRRRARRRSSPSSAARSPPTGGSPRRRCRISRRPFRICGARGRRRRRCPAATSSRRSFGEWERNKGERYPFLEPGLVWRLCRAYGTRVDFLLSNVARQEDMGIDFGAGLSQREVDYLIENEWAETAEDILWRRSKLGLHVGRGRPRRARGISRAGRRSPPGGGGAMIWRPGRSALLCSMPQRRHGHPSVICARRSSAALGQR